MTLRDYFHIAVLIVVIYVNWETMRINRMLKAEARCRELNRTKAQEQETSNDGTIRNEGGLNTRVDDGKSSEINEPPLS